MISRTHSLLLVLCTAGCIAPDLPVTSEGPDDVLEVVIEGGTNVVPDEFPTVAAALADAHARDVRHILVRQGTYDELPLRIDKRVLDIRAEGDVTLRAVLAGQPLIEITDAADEVELHGLHLVQPSALGGAVIASAGRFVLRNTRVSAPAGTGIALSQGSLLMEDSTLQEVSLGLHVQGGLADIHRSRVLDGGLGVVIEGGTNLRMLHSIVAHMDHGITTGGEAHLRHVTVSDTRVGVIAEAGGVANLSHVALAQTDDPLRCDGTLVEHRNHADAADDCAPDLAVSDDLMLDADLRPTLHSPLVDAGDVRSDSERDIAGGIRPIDGNFDGVPGSDVGAWELALPECPHWSESHTSPPVGTWGPSFHPEPSIDCAAEPDAGAMWRGRVVQAWEDRVLLEYFVDAAHTPDVDVQWWLLDATEAPNCSSLEHMPVVSTGTMAAGKPTLRVEVDPWADAESDPAVRRRLLLATGSPGAPLERVWYTPNAIEVSRTCE